MISVNTQLRGPRGWKRTWESTLEKDPSNAACATTRHRRVPICSNTSNGIQTSGHSNVTCVTTGWDTSNFRLNRHPSAVLSYYCDVRISTLKSLLIFVSFSPSSCKRGHQLITHKRCHFNKLRASGVLDFIEGIETALPSFLALPNSFPPQSPNS